MIRKPWIGIVLCTLVAVAGWSSLNLDKRSPNADGATTVNWVFAERNPRIIAFYDEVIADFEARNPGVEVKYRYLARMSQRLPTLIASPTKPDILFTQGAGLLQQLYDIGAVRDLSAEMLRDGWSDSFVSAALDNFTYDGAIIGVPHHITKVDFYYNKDLFRQAGLDAGSVETWDDFLHAVDTLRAFGVTPIAAGPADPWTVGSYFGLAATRVCGKEAFRQAMQGRGQGFRMPCMIEAAGMVRQLAEADSFQEGFAASKYPKATGLFGDGKAAMVMAYSATTPSEQQKNASDGIGLATGTIGFFSMPVVPGTPGSRTDIYGAVGGWALTTGSSKAALEFLRFLTNRTNQQRLAELGLNIPVHVDAGRRVTDPMLQTAANEVRQSGWFQTFIENAMPAAVGQTMHDVTVDLLNSRIEPEEAMRKLQAVAELG